ncbi:MAG: PEP-CTERM system TPR-repeat protein PrsT [Gammaproteobacteria bacterium]|jgi:putative PEP-CTERM system TPR-repeat lipoprotein|nr:PEP-CTERM system TPR-repeat protein PrsT [Gammaproteobacteria bacterium]
MHKTFRRSLLSLAVLQAIGTGMAAPGTALANESEQSSATAAFAQTRDLRRELIELKNAVIESPEDASLRFELGKLYLRIGDAASAEKELRRAQDLGLDDYELLLTLGEVWIAQGDFRRVITDDALLDTQDAEQRAALKTLQGQALLVQGRTDEARDHFAEALIQVEDYGPAWLAMAESHLTDDDVVAAQQAMSRARTAADLDAAELLRVEANIAFTLERFDDAIDYYRQALEKRRGDPVLLRGLAVSQLAAKRPQAASDTLDRLLAQNPNNGDALALKARAALLTEDYRTAAELAGAVVGSGNDERRVGALLTAGAASLFSGAPRQAQEYLGRYVAQRPNDANARRLLGQALLQLDSATEAYEMLRPLADQAQDDAQLLSELAIAAAGGGAPNEAVDYLERAVELTPDNARLKAQLAAARVATEDRRLGLQQLDELAAQDDSYALLALDTALNRLNHGELGSAIATAARVQTMAPDAVGPTLVRAVALLKAGELDAAEAAFAKVLDEQPDNIGARTGMAEARLRRGEIDQALAAFAELVADYPGDITLQLNFAAAERQAGRTFQAQQRLERIVADHPESVVPRIALAKSYLADGLPQRALEVLNDAQSTAAPDFVLTIARAELMADRPQDAVARLEELVASEPGSAHARLALAKAHERNGNAEAAEQMLGSVLQIAPDARTARYSMLRLQLIQPKLKNNALARVEDDAMRFISEQPSEPRSQVLRGLLLFRTDGRRALGLEVLRQVVQDQPSGDLIALVASLHLVNGQAEDAVQLLDNYVSSHPAHTYARLRLARAQMAAGDYDAAADNLVAGIEEGARREGLALATAWTLAAAGRYDEARPYLSQADAEGASGPMMSHARGLMRLGAGDARGAASALQQALRESSQGASARLQLDLATALIETGNRGEAQRILKQLNANELNSTERAAKSAAELRLR